MCASGPNIRSVLALLFAASLATSLSVTSGESKLRPSEFAYFRRMTSRTSSTRSSAPTITCVGDEPGLFTQTLRFAMASTGFELWSSRPAFRVLVCKTWRVGVAIGTGRRASRATFCRFQVPDLFGSAAKHKAPEVAGAVTSCMRGSASSSSSLQTRQAARQHNSSRQSIIVQPFGGSQDLFANFQAEAKKAMLVSPVCNNELERIARTIDLSGLHEVPLPCGYLQSPTSTPTRAS